MNTRSHEAIAKRFNEDEQVDLLIRKAVKKAIRNHFSHGEMVVVWRDGKAVWVGKEEIDSDK
jgi:hypothetical protein